MTDLRHVGILGLTPHSPPEGLKSNCSFGDNDGYVAYLAEALKNNEQYWMKVAESICWVEKPRSLGCPGAWYEGGLVDVFATCLGEGQDRKGVWHYNPDSSSSRNVSSKDIYARTQAIGRQIEKWGLEPRDRVLIASESSDVLLPSLLACLSKGLTCVPVNPRYADDRLMQRGLRTRAKASIVENCCVSADLASQVSGLGEVMAIDEQFDWSAQSTSKPAPLTAMHPAFVLADSSGQLFTLPLAGFLAHAVEAFLFLLAGECRQTTVWVMSEPHHASTLAALFGALVAGADVGLLPVECARTKKTLTAAIEICSAKTVLTNVKSLLPLAKELGAQGEDEGAPTSFLELLVVEGEALEPHVWELLKARMFGREAHVVQVLARPEGGGFVAGPHPAVTPIRPGAVAYAAPGMDIVILDSRGHECKVSHGGLMSLRNVTPGIALEIQNMEPPITLEVKARKDGTGQIWPMGEMAVEISAVEQVSLAELEAAIAGVEGVDQVAVVRSHEEDGSVSSRAFVKPGKSDSDVINRIKNRVTERFGAAAVPAGFQIVRELPVGRSGKLLRSVLRRITSGDPISHEDASLVTDPGLIAELTGKSSD